MMVSFTLFRQYLSLLETRGVDVSSLLAKAGVTEAMREDPNARVLDREHDRLWQLLLSDVPHQYLALNHGDTLSPSTFSSLVYLAMAQDTLYDALQSLLKSKNQGSYIQIECERNGDMVNLFPTSHNTLEYSELYLSLAVQYCLDLLTWLSQHQVLPKNISLPKKPDYGFFAFLTDDRISKDYHAEVPKMSFPFASLDRPLVGSHSQLKSIFQRQAELDLQFYAQEASWVEKLSCYFADCFRRANIEKINPSLQISLDSAADYFHMSPRTLQRKLASEGSHFNQVQGKAKKREIKLLIQQGEQLEKIATHVGFSNKDSLKRFMT